MPKSTNKKPTVTLLTVNADKQWFSQKEAAKAYGISESTIKQARLDGRLPYAELFGKVVIAKKDIERHIKKVY